MNDAFANGTVGDIVATDFRAARVFERFGIDFCCGGRQSLAEACRAAAVDPQSVVRELEALPPLENEDDDASSWPLDRLIDHIERTHHVYVRAALPRIREHLRRLVEVHGTRHSELSLVAERFDRLNHDLTRHLLKEEQVLFPYVRELVVHAESDDRLVSPFGTIENPIQMMEREHSSAGDDLGTIRKLTHGYATPSDGCATYSVCMAELQEFEQDLHRHVHLENNILFPKAIALETGLLAP